MGNPTSPLAPMILTPKPFAQVRIELCGEPVDLVERSLLQHTKGNEAMDGTMRTIKEDTTTTKKLSMTTEPMRSRIHLGNHLDKSKALRYP